MQEALAVSGCPGALSFPSESVLKGQSRTRLCGGSNRKLPDFLLYIIMSLEQCMTGKVTARGFSLVSLGMGEGPTERLIMSKPEIFSLVE